MHIKVNKMQKKGEFMNNYNVIVIGGGPSGLMAAIAAAEQGAKVALLDKGNKLGRKLGISGGGRCNVTNNKEISELITYIPGGGRFLHSALAQFNNQDIIQFFEGLGIALKEEDNGRMFPVSDRAKTVVDALIGYARTLGVSLLTHHTVANIIYKDNEVKGVNLTSGEQISARSVVVATGGKSVPHTGSTGDGYPWAIAAGHSITELYPTEVPIISKEPFITNKELQGLSLRNVKLAVLNHKGKNVVAHQGDMIFTHFGISGPIALRCSGFIRGVKQKSGLPTVTMSLDLFPELSIGQLEQQLLSLLMAEPKKVIKNVLKGNIPERLLPLLMERSGLSQETTYEHLRKDAFRSFIETVKSFQFQVTGTRSFEEAFVTGGGVNLKEIVPSTMESKLMNGLFFCGEVLDVHGYTGGYNITAAFSTGHTAGHHAALRV